jgi:hypothetical protein
VGSRGCNKGVNHDLHGWPKNKHLSGRVLHACV